MVQVYFHIDGTLSEYIQKMKQKGFTHIGTEDDVAMLTGDFAAYKNCRVNIATLKQKDLVSKIMVEFSSCDTWSALVSNYVSLKEMLIKKYGKPLECVEKFQSNVQPKNDNAKMSQVRCDNCEYCTTWQTEKGNIRLSISHKMYYCFVTLAYFDKINGEIIEAKAMEDL